MPYAVEELGGTEDRAPGERDRWGTENDIEARREDRRAGQQQQQCARAFTWRGLKNYDAYIHRIGRTGRADKKGIALTFIG